MIPLTRELEQHIRQSGKKLIPITLEDLAKAQILKPKEDGSKIPHIQTADPGSFK